MHHWLQDWRIIAGFSISALTFVLGYWIAPKAKAWLVQRGQNSLIAELQASLEGVTRQLEQTDRECSDWQRRAREYLAKIEGVLQEKSTWENLHIEETIAHGNAQVIMMDVIARAERALQKAGVKFEVPDVVLLTQQLYADRYLDPVIRSTGTPVIRREQPAASSPATMSTERAQVDSSRSESQG